MHSVRTRPLLPLDSTGMRLRIGGTIRGATTSRSNMHKHARLRSHHLVSVELQQYSGHHSRGESLSPPLISLFINRGSSLTMNTVLVFSCRFLQRADPWAYGADRKETVVGFATSPCGFLVSHKRRGRKLGI